jgi:hypothetical protein
MRQCSADAIEQMQFSTFFPGKQKIRKRAIEKGNKAILNLKDQSEQLALTELALTEMLRQDKVTIGELERSIACAQLPSWPMRVTLT